MKHSSEDLLSNLRQFRLFSMKRKYSTCIDRESPLGKLYVNLCNLIVESRIPGINERGYGEGIHCPPQIGSSNHCCNLSIPECQKYEKMIQRLFRGSRRCVFDIEVLLLPECCKKEPESKLSERIAKKEYILLEKWSLNIQVIGRASPFVDVNQLLRAVRSFLYFSQLSAWLSSSKGKSPSNIYYWIKTPTEVFCTKFETEPVKHVFPTCKIGDNLCGSVEVKYRRRTEYVPIIPCSKHPPTAGNPLQIINIDTISCQNIPINIHAVKQLKKPCDTEHQNAILTKNAINISSTLTSPTLFPIPIKANSGETSAIFNSKQSRNVKYSSSQVNDVENVFGSVSNLCKDGCKTSNPESRIPDVGIYQNIYSNCASQENISNKKHSTQFQDLESRHIKTDNHNSLSNIQSIKTSPGKNIKVSRKRRFSDKITNTETNTSQFTLVDREHVSAACTSSSCNDSQQLCLETDAKKSKATCTLKLHIPHKIFNYQENLHKTSKELYTVEIASSDIKTSLENINIQKGPVLGGKKETLHVLVPGQDVNGGLPLPSSPVPDRGDTQNTSALLNPISVNNRKNLFPKPNFNEDSLQKRISSFNKAKRLLGSYEESLLQGCIQPVNSVKGFAVDIGASGSFFPNHLILPTDVYFYEMGSPYQEAAPYVAHVLLQGVEYYVPKKGAVQVTLFNPSGTVVRIFVVNYDLTSMPPMCHTFIRQKTYYMPLNATEHDPSSKKWLRYIIHLRFASTKTGRVFLHSDFKLLIVNKSDVDAASIHSEEPHELRSFISMPTNPSFSKR